MGSNFFYLINCAVLFAFSFVANAQVNDSIYSVPKGTDRIDTIRFDSTNGIRFIEFIAQDKVLKRLFYNKEYLVISAADYYDDIGRTIWEITWYPNGKLRSLWYHNMEIGQTWYEDGKLQSNRNLSNDTVLSIFYFESGKINRIVKKLSGYDSTNYYYQVDYCENGFKRGEEFSGKEYIYRYYYCNGKKEIECKKDSNDFFVGEYKKWNAKGILILDGQFNSDRKPSNYTTIQDGKGFGQKDGNWLYYNDRGKLIKTEFYKEGKLIYANNVKGKPLQSKCCD